MEEVLKMVSEDTEEFLRKMYLMVAKTNIPGERHDAVFAKVNDVTVIMFYDKEGNVE